MNRGLRVIEEKNTSKAQDMAYRMKNILEDPNRKWLGSLTESSIQNDINVRFSKKHPVIECWDNSKVYCKFDGDIAVPVAYDDVDGNKVDIQVNEDIEIPESVE